MGYCVLLFISIIFFFVDIFLLFDVLFSMIVRRFRNDRAIIRRQNLLFFHHLRDRRLEEDYKKRMEFSMIIKALDWLDEL